MRADYSPAPGTTAYRVIAHMETLPAGAEVMTSALAEAIGVPANNLTPCLEAAVNAGKLFRRQRDNHIRSPYWWSLTDRAGGQPPPKRQTVYVPDEPKTPQKGANRDASTGQSHGAEGSESPNGRGSNAAPALGAAPAFTSEPEGTAAIAGGPATAEETTQRGAGSADIAATRETAIGAGDDAKPAVGAAVPNGLRIALWSDGALQVQTPRGDDLVVFSRDEVRQLVEYLSDPAMALREQGASA